MAKQRIAILGGGMGSLTAAFEITNDPGWQNDYDITVYQLGWRLGGKGASGRNPERSQRIEEHGLHIFLGFYENAFRVMKAAYAELGRPKGAPLAEWSDAFKPHDYVVLMEKLDDGSYVPWPMDFPPNSGVPGCGGVLPTPWELLEMIIGWLKELVTREGNGLEHHPALDDAHDHAKAKNHDGVVAAMHELHDWLHGKIKNTEEHVDWRRAFVTADLGFAATKGVAASGVVWTGDWFKLDTMDFREWLSHYGAHDVSVNSAYIKGMYDLGFSLPGQVGAGTAINGILRMCWTYKGAVMWKMQAGMGDTIFAPLYEVLKKRGVRFEFFSRVDELTLSDDKTRVETIKIGRQATPTKGLAGYDPLVEVKGLPCWPSVPRYGELVEGEALRASGANLEDWWTEWKDVGSTTLRAGEDFHRVILGCSPAIFPYIAKDVIAKNKPFARMVEKLWTTQTQALQLWMTTTLEGLGWDLPSPVLDAYAEPMDTWADMTHLLPREDWTGPVVPTNLAYLCSPLPDDDEPKQPGYAQKQNARVKKHALQWLNEYAQGLWPKGCAPRGAFDWKLLLCDQDSTSAGPDRLDQQYWIATMNPSDRYVLAYPNTVDYRLTTQGHGIQNLYLAGDYLKTGMNVGCVEAATMGGMHASQKICGRPAVIVGDHTDPITNPSPVQLAPDPSCGKPGANEMGPRPRRAERDAESVVDTITRGAKALVDDVVDTLERDTKGMVETIERGAKGLASRARNAMGAALDAIRAGHEELGRPSAAGSTGAGSTGATRTESSQPAYIARGGDLAMAPPLKLEGATMYSFLLDADHGALRTLIDRQLNAVTRAAGVTYQPLLPAVSFVCADVTKSYSLTPPDSEKGWMSERDFGFWIPVVNNRGKIGWYLPYVFVDNVAAMVTGREVFGFFKQTATLTLPPSPSVNGAFSIDDAIVIETFSPSSQGKPITLLTATTIEGRPAPEGGRWESAREALDAVLGEMKTVHRELESMPISSWTLLENAFGELVTGDVPMVFLKQFRGETAAATAAYRAVIEAPAHLDRFHGGWFAHPHDITITPADSHPIAKDCGLGTGPLRSRLAFWCQMDFTMQPGRIIAGG